MIKTIITINSCKVVWIKFIQGGMNLIMIIISSIHFPSKRSDEERKLSELRTLSANNVFVEETVILYKQKSL